MTISGNKITESIINNLQEIPLDKQKQILEYVGRSSHGGKGAVIFP